MSEPDKKSPSNKTSSSQKKECSDDPKINKNSQSSGNNFSMSISSVIANVKSYFKSIIPITHF